MKSLQSLLLLACWVTAGTAACVSSKYNGGTRDWLRCSEVGFPDVQNQLQSNLVAISVSHSVIPELPDLGFVRNSTALEILNIHESGLARIGNEAFRGLTSVKKLSLSYNNITSLNVSWFYDLPSLEQLDVSFNLIAQLDPNIYFHLSKLLRFDLNDNKLNCIPTQNLEHVRKLRDIRIHENPLTYACRAPLTRWLRDRGIAYATDEDNFKWLDEILWQCYFDFENNQETYFEKDKKMNICVLSNMFNQLTTVLGASPSSMQTSVAECSSYRNSLTQCLKNHNVVKNGDFLINVLGLMQKESKIVAP